MYTLFSAMSDYSLITAEMIKELAQKAKQVPRKRINHNVHLQNDTVQRMLNAIEPDSYVRPHRHLNPPKIEAFFVFQGSLAVIFFNDTGDLKDVVILNEQVKGIDIKPGVWHSIVALESGTVIFEVKTGPYIQATDKDFAPWAPQENIPEARVYLEKMKKYIQEKQR